jgi:hypothetical protein
VVVRPLAFCVHGFRLDRDWKAGVQRWAYRTWARLGKTVRVTVKRLVIRPLRLIVWWLARLIRWSRRVVVRAYRVARKLLRLAVLAPVRLARLARYHVGVRLRGAALGDQGDDGRSAP